MNALNDVTNNRLDNNNLTSTALKATEHDSDFSEKFCRWLKKTEKQIDSAGFEKLKGELFEVVGRYELEKNTKRN